MNRSESKYFNTARRMAEALVALMEKKDFQYISVKEICAKAEVNRSTFYLHYENTADLLADAVEMIHERFHNSIPDADVRSSAISYQPRSELFFVKDKWLLPYLAFVRENKNVYKAIHTQMERVRCGAYLPPVLSVPLLAHLVPLWRCRGPARIHHDLLPPRAGGCADEVGGLRLPGKPGPDRRDHQAVCGRSQLKAPQRTASPSVHWEAFVS